MPDFGIFVAISTKCRLLFCYIRLYYYYTVSKELFKLIFCQNFVKCRPMVKIFVTMIAKRTSFSEMYSFSTSPNLCQRINMQ